MRHAAVHSAICVGLALLASPTVGTVLGEESPAAVAPPTEVWFRARPGQERLTIRQALETARNANPALRRAQLAIESAAGDRKTAGFRINPNASTILFGLNKPVGSQLYQVTQTIETGGKRRNRVEVAKRGQEIADRSATDAGRVLHGQVRQTFIRVLRAISDVEFADETLRSFDRTMVASGGKTGPAEHLPFRITTERIDLSNELERALLGVELAKHDLAELLAAPDIWRTHDVDGGLAFLPVSLTLRRLEETARANRPDWQAARFDVERAKSALKLAESQTYWNLTVGPSLTHVEGVSSDSFGFLVGAQPQIFNRNQGEIKKAHAEIARSEASQKAVELAIAKDVRRVHDRFVVARRIVNNYLGRHLCESRQALESSETAYGSGKMSLTDYLDTLRAYRRFHFGYRGALADYLATLTDVNLFCGQDLAAVDDALTLPAHAVHLQRYVPNPLSGPGVRPPDSTVQE